jgi:hypothetical protein
VQIAGRVVEAGTDRPIVSAPNVRARSISIAISTPQPSTNGMELSARLRVRTP